MADTTDRNVYVTNQPVIGNPFDQLNDEWTVQLFSCSDDISQCELINKLSECLYMISIGCYAYWCWCCFLGSLAGKINEPKISCCCVPGVLGVYRMKVRSILKIKVNYSIK